MDTRLLAEDERPLAKALWKEAFHDSDAFIDWYFENKLPAGSSLGLFGGGALVSVVHMIPYRLRIQGRPIETAFIAGAATSLQRRGEGLMKGLLRETLALLKSRGIFLTHLYPFSHAFYERLGWAAITSVNRQTVSAAGLLRGVEVIETVDADVLAPLYSRMMKAYDGYVIRGEREWAWRLGELQSDGGRCAVLLKDDLACAYMLFYSVNGKADIIETVYRSEEDIGALLAYVLSLKHESAEYFTPSEGADAAPHAMARVVDTHALLDAFGATGLLDEYDVTDDFAPWNNTGGGRPKSMSAAELARLVHGGGGRPDDGAGRYFVPQKACIFEAF